MKRTRFWLVWLACAAVCVALSFALSGTSGEAILGFPWIPLADALRLLSFSGPAGNVLAWALILLAAFLPFLCWLLFARNLSWKGLAVFPAAACVFFFSGMYARINPGLYRHLPLGVMMPYLFVGLGWSLILFFLLLHVVRSCRDQKTGTLLRLGIRLTHLFLILQIFSACCVGFAALRGSWADLLTANTDPNVALWPTQALFLLEYVLQLFVCVLSLRVGEKAIALLFALSREKDGVDEAEALTRAASSALLWTAGSHLALQIVKILCVRILLTVDLTVELPLLPLVLILACLLLSRLLADRRRLRRENESFI